MASTAPEWPRAQAVFVDERVLRVRLRDGREIVVPLEAFGFLAAAAPKDRQSFRIEDDGRAIWWDRLQDGVSVPGLFGLPESPPRHPQRTYLIRYRREGSRWIAEIPNLDSSTHARSLAGAKHDARWLLGELLGVPDLVAAGIEVIETVDRPGNA